MRVRSVFGAMAGVLGAGVLYQRWGAWRDRRRYAAPGRLVQVGPRRIHWDQRGMGEPMVVLEAGLSSTSLSWALVQDRISSITTVASYDRAGLGWSDQSDEKPSVLAILSDLHTLIQLFSRGRRVILVGHSFGGLLVRAYSRLFPDRVAGLILLDPVSVEQWSAGSDADVARLKRGARLARRGAWLAELGVVRLCLTILARGHTAVPKLITRGTSSTQGEDLVNRLTKQIQRLPQEMWPLVRAHWSRAASFRVLAEYLQALPANARGLVGVRLAPRIPLTILSASTATPAELEERNAWADASERGQHWRIPDSGHWLQLDVPDVVAQAIEDMVLQSSV